MSIHSRSALQTNVRHVLHVQMYPTMRKKLKLKLIYDRQSVGQSVLVSGTHLGPATKFSFSLKFSFRQLRLCY
jgi:hypothetical protein